MIMVLDLLLFLSVSLSLVSSCMGLGPSLSHLLFSSSSQARRASREEGVALPCQSSCFAFLYILFFYHRLSQTRHVA